jgi:hypothetical protein
MLHRYATFTEASIDGQVSAVQMLLALALTINILNSNL